MNSIWQWWRCQARGRIQYYKLPSLSLREVLPRGRPPPVENETDHLCLVEPGSDSMKYGHWIGWEKRVAASVVRKRRGGWRNYTQSDGRQVNIPQDLETRCAVCCIVHGSWVSVGRKRALLSDYKGGKFGSANDEMN